MPAPFPAGNLSIRPLKWKNQIISTQLAGKGQLGRQGEFFCYSCGCFLIRTACVPLDVTDYAVPEEPPDFLAEKTIAVLPFTGSVAVLEPAGEWFAHKLAMSGMVKVISPAQAELLFLESERTTPLQWENPQEAANLGRTIGAQLVAIGSLSTKPSLIQWDAVCEVTLIDTRNGEQIGKYKGADMINNWDPAVSYMRAANNAAYEIIGAKNIP